MHYYYFYALAYLVFSVGVSALGAIFVNFSKQEGNSDMLRLGVGGIIIGIDYAVLAVSYALVAFMPIVSTILANSLANLLLYVGLAVIYTSMASIAINSFRKYQNWVTSTIAFVGLLIATYSLFSITTATIVEPYGMIDWNREGLVRFMNIMLILLGSPLIGYFFFSPVSREKINFDARSIMMSISGGLAAISGALLRANDKPMIFWGIFLIGILAYVLTFAGLWSYRKDVKISQSEKEM